MLLTLFKETTPLKGILMLFILALFGFLTFLFLGMLVNYIFWGGASAQAVLSMDTTSNSGLMGIRILQTFQSVGLFVFPPILMALMFSSKPLSYLGFKRVTFFTVGLSMLLMVVFIPGINLIASLNALIPFPNWMLEMEEAAERLIKSMLITESIGIALANILVVAIVPAIGEELFFRGVLQKYIVKWTGREFLGILITAAIFSAIHMQFQGFFPRLLLGMLFGYLYLWSGSIWVPIAVHFVNNGLAVVIYLLIGKGLIAPQTDTLGNLSDMWQVGVVSLFLASLLLIILWRERIKHPEGFVPTSEDL
jgi:uncharacterized protein